jgi:predicted restriction endonuclease
MFRFLRTIFNKEDQFGKRSPGWRNVRNKFVKNNPRCSACGSKNNLEVHHITPYHIDPSLELEHSNLIVLCRNHHYTFGHFCDWTSWNKDVQTDVVVYNAKRVMRPHKEEVDNASNNNSTSTNTFSYNFFSWNN